jgi:hypothetical protein
MVVVNSKTTGTAHPAPPSTQEDTMFRFTRTTGIVAAIALTASLYSVTSASAFNPGVRNHAPVHHGMRHHGGGGYGRAMAIGAGIGLGVAVLGAVIQAQQAQQARPVEVIREPTRVRPPKPKKAPVVAEAPTPVRTVHPVMPIYTKVVLPDVQEDKNCTKDCGQLWQSILHYKQIIAEDTRKIDERKAQAKTREAELKQFTDAAAKATTVADKRYNNDMANITRDSLRNIEESIQTLSAIVADEKRILDDRIRQYEDCVKRACAQQVGAAPVGVTPR